LYSTNIHTQAVHHGCRELVTPQTDCKICHSCDWTGHGEAVNDRNGGIKREMCDVSCLLLVASVSASRLSGIDLHWNILW